MTYEEYITDIGVALPISGFEDLFFDYLEELNSKGYDIPLEYIMEALYATQELVPLLLDEGLRQEGRNVLH